MTPPPSFTMKSRNLGKFLSNALSPGEARIALFPSPLLLFELFTSETGLDLSPAYKLFPLFLCSGELHAACNGPSRKEIKTFSFPPPPPLVLDPLFPVLMWLFRGGFFFFFWFGPVFRKRYIDSRLPSPAVSGTFLGWSLTRLFYSLFIVSSDVFFFSFQSPAFFFPEEWFRSLFF